MQIREKLPYLRPLSKGPLLGLTTVIVWVSQYTVILNILHVRTQKP